MALFDRENLVPIVGLSGLLLAGGLMLFATSGRQPAPASAVAPGGPKAKSKSKVRPRASGAAPSLVFKGELGDRQPAPEGAPNLVVVTGCSLRRDTLGPYGGPAGLTPRLDAFAKQGTRFDDALAAGVWSREAMAAMFTGMHALDLGLVEPGAKPSNRRLKDKHTTAAEVLSEAGWWTVGVNAVPGMTRADSALWQGFDHLRDAHPSGWKANHRLADAQATQVGLAMLAERPPDRPFLLQLMLGDSHRPWKLPQGESQHWASEGLPNPVYLATIRRADDALGLVLDWLDAQGLADSTYVVFTADHGEGLDRPKHLGPSHGRYLGQNVVQIPWIVRGPGIPAGGVVGGLASGVDVAPTLLGLAGLRDGLGVVSGQDLSPSLRQPSRPTGRQEAISDTWFLQANRAAIWTQTRQCQGDFGSIGIADDGFVPGCFDRKTDPDFETPIQDEALHAKLAQWREERAGEATP